MIKLKIKDKPDYVNISKKYNNYSVLEGIILLDIAIDTLRTDFKLSDNDIWKLLKEYRKGIKKVD